MRETERLLIRLFQADDLEEIQRILSAAFEGPSASLEERREWLDWSRLNQVWLPRLHQPPYGDQAVVLKSSGALIGPAGLVPLLDVYDQVPGLGDGRRSGLTRPEVGLFWAIDPACQRQGFASEAGAALISFAFEELKIKRLLATTEHANIASQGVMKRLGMRLLRNPHPEPSWLQVVGVLDNPGLD